MKLTEMPRPLALLRPLDPHYVTNALIMILSPMAAAVAFGMGLLTDTGFAGAIVDGFYVGAATGLAWALSRELDPDYDMSAFIAVGLAWVGMLLYSAPVVNLLALGMVLAVLRLISRIVGPLPSVADSGLVLVLIAMTAFTDNWLAALVGVAALLIDGLMIQPARHHIGVAGVGLAIVILRTLVLDTGETGYLSSGYLVVIVIVSAAYMMTVVATRTLRVGTDQVGYSLDIRRVRAAMVVGLAAVLVVALWDGSSGVTGMLPLWCAIISTVLFRLPVTAREWFDYRQRRIQV